MSDLPDLALSIRQPWAWAILYAGKRLENRSRHAIQMGGMKPGRIAIHASKGMTRAEYEDAADFIANRGGSVPAPADLIRGAIVGMVTVTEIVTRSSDPWFEGPCALALIDPTPCEPIPVGGALGFFHWRKNVGQSWSATTIEPPKPWMVAAKAPGSLFGDIP
jgi:hypothetical protein